MHNFTQRALTSEAQDFVSELRQDLIDEFKDSGAKGVQNAIEERLKTGGRHEVVIAFRAPDGHVLAGNLSTWPPTVVAQQNWRLMSLFRTGQNKAQLVGLTTYPLPSGYQLLTGKVMEDEARLRLTSEQAFIAALVLGLVLAVLGAFLFARFIGRRVSIITSVAQHVRSGDLSHRVPLDNSEDAFDMLSQEINSMLNRIEGLVSELRLVTDSLAHDLRSPVTRLKATVERAITSTRDLPTLEALGTVSEEADRLQNMLTTALQISRAEAGLGRDQFKEFDCAALMLDLTEVYGPLAEEQGFQIAFDGPDVLKVNGHRELLGQAISNLIDNSLKYAKGGDKIILRLEPHSNHITISVEDNGVGIEPEQRDEALRRFGRLDAARQAGGAGLGMSLVTTIAHLHGGSLTLENNTPGLRVVLTLPIVVML